ncbi:MAG: head GIN domain-containing protein [Sphingomonadaceae bacterium]
MANSESRASGPDGTRTFAVGAFNAVSLEGSDNVRVVRGAAISVTATGPQRVLNQLNIRVERNTLKIDRKSDGLSWKSGDYRGAVITVTMPTINAVSVGGSGDMTVDRADGDAFGAAVGGSGNLKIAAMAVKRAQLAVEGSGEMTIAGAAADAAIAVKGSGNIDARNLVTQRATIAAEGSGNIGANVRESATIAVGGSGDVAVTGTENCAIAKSGSGSARCSR